MKKIAGIILILILVLSFFPFQYIPELITYAGSVLDYRDQKPKDLDKPSAGLRIRIINADGTYEDITAVNYQFPTGYAKVGDRVEIYDASTLGGGSAIIIGDYQYVTPSGNEVVTKKSISQYGKIDSFKLTEEGTYSFYLAVMDNGITSDEKYSSWWENWSENGLQEAEKELEDGNIYRCYFICIDIEVEDVEEDKITINYLEKGTNVKLRSSQTKTMALGQNTYSIPAISGYTFLEWIFNNGSPSTDDPMKVYNPGGGGNNELDVYFKSDTPTQIKAVIVAPDEVKKNTSFQLDGTNSYTSDGTWITKYKWESRKLSGGSWKHSSYGDKFPHVGISEDTEFRLTVENNRGDNDSTTAVVKIKEDNNPNPGGDDGAELDFKISKKIEERGGFIGGYDSNFKIIEEYIEGYEDDPPYYGIEEWELKIRIEGSIIETLNYVVSDFNGNPQPKIGHGVDSAITDWASGKAEGEYDVSIYMNIYGRGQTAGDAESATLIITDSGGSSGNDFEVEIVTEDENGVEIPNNISPNPIDFETDGHLSVPAASLAGYILKKAEITNLGADGTAVEEISDLTALDDGNLNFNVKFDGNTTILVNAESQDVNLKLDNDKMIVKYIYKKDTNPSSIKIETSKDSAKVNELVGYTVSQTNCQDVKVYRKEETHSKKSQLLTKNTFTSPYPKRVYVVAVAKGNFIGQRISISLTVKPEDEESKLLVPSPIDAYTIDEIKEMAYFCVLAITGLDKSQVDISIDPNSTKWTSDVYQSKISATGEHLQSYRFFEVKVNSNYWYSFDRTYFYDEEYSSIDLDAEPKKQKTNKMITLIPTLINTSNEKYYHGNYVKYNYPCISADKEIEDGLEFTSDEEGEEVAVVIAKGKFFKSGGKTIFSNNANKLLRPVEQARSLARRKSDIEEQWEKRLGNSNFNITLLPETYVWDSEIRLGYASSPGTFYKYKRYTNINYIIDTDYDDVKVEFVDDLELGRIIVECRDSLTDGLIKTVKLESQELNKDISVDAPTVEGYDFDSSKISSPQTVELTDSEKEKTITFYYKKGSPDPSGGIGKIVFNPNTSDDITGNREGWVKNDINVFVSIDGDKTAERSNTASRSYEYKEEYEVQVGEDEDGNPIYETKTRTVSDSASCSFTETWQVGIISVTGSATGTVSGMSGGNVTISTEGSNLNLSAKLNEWVSVSKVWNEDSAPNSGSWTEHGTPGGSTTPPDLYTGTSGIYKLDKTKPSSSSSIGSKGWTNVPYSVTITATDNLSGFWNGTSYYDVTDKSHYGNSQGRQYFTKYSTNESKTININQNGVYNIYVALEDIARNVMSTRIYGVYRFDNVNPYSAQFDIVGCSNVVQRNIPGVGNGYQYMADYDNKVRVTIGDDLSGLADTRFLLTSSSSFPSLSSMKNLNEGTPEAISAPIYSNEKSIKLYNN